MSDIRGWNVLLACALLGAFGCSHDKSEPPAAQAPEPDRTSGAERNYETPSTPAIEEPAPPASNPAVSERNPQTTETEQETAGPVSDEQIVRILATVNSGEIEQAQLAQNKAKDVRVKKFATLMVDQHSKAKQKGQQLAKQEQLLPANSSVANELADKGSQVIDSLNHVDGPDFDKTYIDAQIQQHQAVLDLLNARLIPSAANARLKSELDDAKTMVQHHLDKAKELQAQTQR